MCGRVLLGLKPFDEFLAGVAAVPTYEPTGPTGDVRSHQHAGPTKAPAGPAKRWGGILLASVSLAGILLGRRFAHCQSMIAD